MARPSFRRIARLSLVTMLPVGACRCEYTTSSVTSAVGWRWVTALRKKL
jgi:hypothetical protein